MPHGAGSSALRAPVRVEVLDPDGDALDLEPGWEDVVEVSLTTTTAQMTLLGWGGGSADDLDLGANGTFRLR